MSVACRLPMFELLSLRSKRLELLLLVVSCNLQLHLLGDVMWLISNKTTSYCLFPWCMAGQNLNQNTIQQHLCDYWTDLTLAFTLACLFQAHNMRHTVSVNAWFKAAPAVLHLKQYHTYKVSNSAKNPQWNGARPFSWSELWVGFTRLGTHKRTTKETGGYCQQWRHKNWWTFPLMLNGIYAWTDNNGMVKWMINVERPGLRRTGVRHHRSGSVIKHN